ncbi:TPA: polysaccharide biosynthesis C-terminal domain-containing protein [Acinetobacter baumannii]|uniref:Wzx n=3 Tax=Acinetobacter baumannii TaxID=470 RepID=A0A6B9D241_ACIBA|nr:polysaccharide biosynthesis C-terminal domain-containing protein [Acinetobacter baumannii]EHU1490991.1 oligosaccharide flippase family protein [Acinetobacter baumannii]EIM5576611.1 oligosaccharide flippase family protein [Acinetobacter baumannii]EIO1628270.1 oligosaccharide flippase family protein [Acinetobacter baumannii]EKT9891494.1 oligosaccharide flippase family protein [Acinetobacter baumannii]EKT9963871.1 oligosaccharide flippase family protein [Acinetobacter baumannii]
MKEYIFRLLKNSRIQNSMWMVLEKGVAFFGLIFVVSAVAKYLGPEVYGYLALAASVFSIVNVVARLGLDQVYFKTASKNQKNNNILLKNMMNMISLIYFPLSIIVLGVFYFRIESTYFIFFIATAIANYFSAIDMRSIHFNAILMSRLNVIANTIGLMVSLAIRYLIVNFQLHIQWLCVPIIIVTLLPYLFRLYVDHKKNIFERTYTYNKYIFRKYRTYFLAVGIPLVISMLSVSIYLQSANFFLAALKGSHAVGIYAVGSMLAGAWYFIPTTIVISFLSIVYKTNNEKDYVEQAGLILRYLLLITLTIIAILYFLSEYIILWLYGIAFKESILIFKILLFSYFFSVIGFYFYRLVMKFGGYNFLAKKMTITCILNIILSYLLIKAYGVIGAAYAALITEFVSNLIFNLFYKNILMPKVILKALGGKP